MSPLQKISDASPKQRRASRLAVGGAFFLHGLCFSSWATRIPAVQQKLVLSEAALGSVLFAVPVGLMISMPFTSWAVPRFGSRHVLRWALLGYAAMLMTLGLAASTLQLTLFLFGFGVVSNMVNVSINTQAVGVESLYGKSVMASLHGLWSLAGFTGAALGTMMIGLGVAPFFHFTSVFLFAVGAVLIGARHLLPDPPARKTASSKRFRMPDGTLLGLGTIALFSMICEGTMFDWSGVYFKKVVGAEQAWIGAGYTAFMSTMAGTRFIADRFVNRYGLKKILQLSGLLTTLGLSIAVTFPFLVPSIFGFLLIGAGVSAVVPLTFGAAGKATASPSTAIATVSTIGFIGFLIGPPLIGWIAEATSLRVSFSLVAIMGLGIAFLSLALRNETSQSPHV